MQAPYNPNPRQCGGPQNSLTLWGEGEPSEVLADYGNAYEVMLFLYDRYGADFMSTLHRDGEHQGLASLDAALDAEGADLYRVLHDYQSMVLLDRIVENRTGVVLGVPKSRVTSASLSSTVNLANPDTYDTPGAAPNGADYVTLQKANGTAVQGQRTADAEVHRRDRPARPAAGLDDRRTTTLTAPATPSCSRATRRTSTSARWPRSPSRPPTPPCACSPSTAPRRATTTATSSSPPTAAPPTPSSPVTRRSRARSARR